MKNIAIMTIAGASMLIAGCQQQQQVEPQPQVVVETGTCDFGAKAAQQGVVTTRTDCNLRGGSFTSYAAAPAAAPATGLVDSSNKSVQTL